MSSHKARSHLPIRLRGVSALSIGKRFVNAHVQRFAIISQLSPQIPECTDGPDRAGSIGLRRPAEQGG